MQSAVVAGPGRAVAILRALPGLGDLLCAVPALRAIRTCEPTARIAYIGLESTRELVGRFDRYVDEFIAFPGFPGLPEIEPDVTAIPSFLAAMQARRFDVAVNLHGDGFVTNPLVALFGARTMAGYDRPWTWVPDRDTFLVHDDSVPEVLRWLRLCAVLGWSSDDARLELPIRPGSAVEPSVSLVAGRPHAVVHPGASVAARRWPVEAFAAVADGLAAAGLPVVLTGTAAERDVTAAVAGAMHADAVDFAGRTSLDGLATIVRSASVVVTNDTGTSHLADALGVASVVAFVDSEVERWAPLDERLHRRIVGSSADAVARARATALELVGSAANGAGRDAA